MDGGWAPLLSVSAGAADERAASHANCYYDQERSTERSAFSSANDIVRRNKKCRKNGLTIFNNERKIDAILSMSARVALDGFSRVKRSVEIYGAAYLQAFDFIGPTTSFHLAKNLGINVSKPDRHLCRVAQAAGFDSVQQLCQQISDVTGDPVSVVDVVIWRFATLRPDYRGWFSQVAIH